MNEIEKLLEEIRLGLTTLERAAMLTTVIRNLGKQAEQRPVTQDDIIDFVRAARPI